MEDREILALFQRRDQEAIPALDAQYGGRLRALAMRLLGSPEDAEECISDTYLAAWNAIPPEEPVYLFAYLAAICRNRALSMLNRENGRFLAGLGGENRRFFLRRYWYAESVKEVAQNCGVSESKVKMSLHRTRKKLREFLQKEGLWQ